MTDVIDRRWIDARERMRPYIDALLWQDLEVPSPDRERYVNWILDKIIKDEYLAALAVPRAD
jgi:hypothetical protein